MFLVTAENPKCTQESCNEGYCESFDNDYKCNNYCNVPQKIIVLAGTETKVIDPFDPNFKCPNMKPFPKHLLFPVGGFLAGDFKKPVVCGGYEYSGEEYNKDCFTFEDGEWREENNHLETPSVNWAGASSRITGSAVIYESIMYDPRLVIFGNRPEVGPNGYEPVTVELARPNVSPNKYTFENFVDSGMTRKVSL